jgi:alanyl-tRNA synthetase
VVLGEESNGSASVLVMVSQDATSRVQAGRVIKELMAISGGRGGGKAELAEGALLRKSGRDSSSRALGDRTID